MALLEWKSWSERPAWRRRLRRIYDAVHARTSPLAPNLPAFNWLFAVHVFIGEMGRLPRHPHSAEAAAQDLLFDRMVHDRWHPFQREVVDKARGGEIALRLDPRVRIPRIEALLDVPPRCRIEEIERLLAPYAGRELIAKPTHSCGGVVDLARADWRMRVRGMQLRMNQDYFHALRESQYRGLPRRIVVQERLGDSSHDLVEYKIHCAWGRAVGVQIDVGRHGRLRRAFVMLDEADRFEWIPDGFDELCFDSAPPRPPTWDLLRSIAETLSRPFDIVRIDLYEIGGEVYFGEFTLTPAAGMLYSRYPRLEAMFNDTWRVGAHPLCRRA